MGVLGIDLVPTAALYCTGSSPKSGIAEKSREVWSSILVAVLDVFEWKACNLTLEK